MNINKYFLPLLIKEIVLFIVGGFSYIIIELMWRNHSHWTMFLLGGVCFLVVGGINNFFTWKIPLQIQALVGSILITLLEFIFGYILNITLGMNIWDYSKMPLNLLGQICLPFSLVWFLLSFLIIYIDDLLRWKLFDEEKPRYIFFKN